MGRKGKKGGEERVGKGKTALKWVGITIEEYTIKKDNVYKNRQYIILILSHKLI